MPTYDSPDWDWGAGYCRVHRGQDLPCKACIADPTKSRVRASYPCVLTEDSPGKRAMYADPAGPAPEDPRPFPAELELLYLRRIEGNVRRRLGQHRETLEACESEPPDDANRLMIRRLLVGSRSWKASSWSDSDGAGAWK